MISGLNAGLSVTAYLLLPARWAVTGMAAAYSVALFAGWAVTAFVLDRRLAAPDGGPGPWRSPTAGSLARLLLVAVPAAALGRIAAGLAAPPGPLAAVAAGAAAVVLVFAAAARPLRLTEVEAARRALLGKLRRGAR